MTNDDWKWMSRALELAERGRGAVEPNPLVGAVIVRDGETVGEGWHERYGGPHAEVQALAVASERARGATLYVTLEPCCHVGKTPPCTAALVRAGLARVVAAQLDPFPQVAGRGLAQLRAAGISVEVGLGQQKACRLNAPYLKLLATGLPYVHAKWAMTLDGKIATRTGDSRWISSEESRRIVHTLRGRMDAVIVGIGTVLADDPLLTARPPGPRCPLRVVLDSTGSLPLDSQLARTAREVPTLLAIAADLEENKRRALEERGCQVLALPGNSEKRTNLAELLRHLGKMRLSNVMVEGGSAVLGSFLDSGMIDEVHAFIAPVLAGGREAPGPMGGRGVEGIATALRFEECRVEMSGGDFYVRAWRWRQDGC